MELEDLVGEVYCPRSRQGPVKVGQVEGDSRQEVIPHRRDEGWRGEVTLLADDRLPRVEQAGCLNPHMAVQGGDIDADASLGRRPCP